MSKSRSEWWIVLACAWLGACEPNACVRESDCTTGFVCRTGHCVIATDAGADADVGPVDGGSDAGSDAGVDAGHDAGSDAASDANVDAGGDAASDADVDAG